MHDDGYRDDEPGELERWTERPSTVALRVLTFVLVVVVILTFLGALDWRR